MKKKIIYLYIYNNNNNNIKLKKYNIYYSNMIFKFII